MEVFSRFCYRIEHDGPRTAISLPPRREAKFECAPNVPQTCTKRTLSAPTDEPRASCGLPTQSRPIRRSSDEARSARRGKARAAPGKVRRGLAQSRSRDRPRSHGRWRRGEAEPGRRGVGSGRGPTKRKGGKRGPAEARQRAQASSAVSPRKSHKPASPVSPQPHKPSSLKSRNPGSPATLLKSRKTSNPASPRNPATPSTHAALASLASPWQNLSAHFEILGTKHPSIGYYLLHIFACCLP